MIDISDPANPTLAGSYDTPGYAYDVAATSRYIAEDALERILALGEGKQCLALGPGIGTGEETKRLVRRLVAESPLPLVVDADGLNCLAGQIDAIDRARAPVVLTPHPGEMARLSGLSTRQIQADRIGCARSFAETHDVVVVLKGAATVVAVPDGRCFVNPTGNPGMASGGIGPFGYLASDVMFEIPAQIRELLEASFPAPGTWPVTGLPLRGQG